MLRDNLVELIEPMLNSAGADPLALYIHTRTPASDDRLPCLKNPRPEGAESSLTESASSPFQAEPAQCGVVQSSAKYDIYLPSKGAPYAQSTSISHSIRENDVDRFMVALNIDGDCVYLVTFNLIYDGDEKSISSGQLLAFRAEASSIYSLSHLSHRSGQSDSLELGQVAWIFHDRKTLDEVGAIGGIRNQALLDMERFIRGSLPYLEKTLAPYKRRLIDLTDGEIASVNEIEGLLDPELGIVIKSFALVSARMTDEALSHLRYMTKLQCLDLSHCREVTDRGLVD